MWDLQLVYMLYADRQRNFTILPFRHFVFLVVISFFFYALLATSTVLAVSGSTSSTGSARGDSFCHRDILYLTMLHQYKENVIQVGVLDRSDSALRTHILEPTKRRISATMYYRY